MKMVIPRLAVLLAAALALAVQAAEDKQPTRVPVPAISVNKDKAEKCVEPTAVMRRDHMKFILHQRDDTMHKGIRTTKHSLKNCVECHADPKTGSVLGKDGFCASCHQYAAVTIDCFGCHTDKAEKRVSAAAPAAGAKP